jgi:tetratricopeptide (TPR) repeat protein
MVFVMKKSLIAAVISLSFTVSFCQSDSFESHSDFKFGLKSDDPDDWYNLGISYRNKGENDAAIAAYQRCIELKPDYDEAWYNMGNAYQAIGKYDEAIASFTKSIEINPDKSGAWINMGNAYHM